MTTVITENLDRLESALPAIPARWVRLQRALAGRAYDCTASALSNVAGSTKTVIDTTRSSGKTVTGQARAAGTNVVDTARAGGRQVVGQAQAQGRRTSGTVQREAEQLLDSAIDAVDTDYDTWTKAELLERAQKLDIAGRSQMSKQQLIDALRL